MPRVYFTPLQETCNWVYPMSVPCSNLRVSVSASIKLSNSGSGTIESLCSTWSFDARVAINVLFSDQTTPCVLRSPYCQKVTMAEGGDVSFTSVRTTTGISSGVV